MGVLLRNACKLSYHQCMAALDELRELGDAWQNRPQLIEKARQEGATWVAIGEALHMTRHGVVKLHATLKGDS